MRTLAHISDLHFGTEKPELVDGLLLSLHDVKPDLIVVSGDLTQQARTEQFQAAREYLTQFPCPYLVVPGNHDVPLFNLWARFQHPLRHYRQYVMPDLTPQFEDQNMAVLGINTARSLTWKNGRVSGEQMQAIRDFFCPLPPSQFKILVTHHPFLPPLEYADKTLVGRAERTLRTVEQCHLDVLLAGHFHQSYSGGSHQVYTMLHHSVLVIQAGTAISNRTRLEKNAYNLIRIHDQQVTLGVYLWNDHQFAEERREWYRRGLHNAWERSD